MHSPQIEAGEARVEAVLLLQERALVQKQQKSDGEEGAEETSQRAQHWPAGHRKSLQHLQLCLWKESLAQGEGPVRPGPRQRPGGGNVQEQLLQRREHADIHDVHGRLLRVIIGQRLPRRHFNRERFP